MSEPNWEELRGMIGDRRTVVIPLDELRADRAAMLADATDVAYDESMVATAWDESATAAATRTFDETKIRRYPKGTKERGREGGGRFAPKDSTGGKSSGEEEKKDGGKQSAVVTTIVDQARYKQTLAKANEPDQGDFEWPAPSSEVGLEMLAGHADTQSRWSDAQGRYLPERLALHDEIVGKFLAQSGMVKQDAPVTLFMAGGSGAGKTSVLGRQATDGSGVFEGGVIEDVPANAVYINPDDVKELLPEYRAMIEAGDPAAASAVHEESSDVAKVLLQTANERGYNVVLDGTGDSGVGKFFGKIEAAQMGGRSARVVLVDIPTDEAVSRAMERARKSGRMVPEKEIRKVHKSVAQNFAQWQDKVDDWELYSNDAGPKLVAKRKAGKRG